MATNLKKLKRRLHALRSRRLSKGGIVSAAPERDVRLAEKVVKRIRAGEEATVPLSEVEARLAARHSK